jgi:hypothetical protein
MTSVNITTNKNTVTIDEDNSSIITVATAGAQGPAWSTTATTLNDSGKVNKSVVYYDSVAGEYKADALQTTLTLVDGGNF